MTSVIEIRNICFNYLLGSMRQEKAPPAADSMRMVGIIYDACSSRDKNQRQIVEKMFENIISEIVNKELPTQEQCRIIDKTTAKLLRGSVASSLLNMAVRIAGYDQPKPVKENIISERQEFLIKTATPLLSRQDPRFSVMRIDADDFWILHKDYLPENCSHQPSVSTHDIDGNTISVINNFISVAECNWWSDTVFNSGHPTNLDQEFPTWYRSGERLLLKSKTTSNRFFELINSLKLQFKSHTPLGIGVESGNWKPNSINEAFRLIKYSKNNFFSVHRDANHNKNPNLRSSKTIMIYLNDDFEGGDLVFTKQKEHQPGSESTKRFVKKTIHDWPEVSNPPEWKQNTPEESLRISPVKGQAVIFDHHLIHYAEKVIEGEKFILRSDLMSYLPSTEYPEFGEIWKASLSESDQAILPLIRSISDAAEGAEREGHLNKSQQLFDILLEMRLTYSSCFVENGP